MKEVSVWSAVIACLLMNAVSARIQKPIVSLEPDVVYVKCQGNEKDRKKEARFLYRLKKFASFNKRFSQDLFRPRS